MYTCICLVACNSCHCDFNTMYATNDSIHAQVVEHSVNCSNMTAFQASSYTVSSTCTAAPLCHLRPTLINSFQVSLNVYLKEVQIYFFIRIIRTTGTNLHLNILTHFLWEGPTEPRIPACAQQLLSGPHPSPSHRGSSRAIRLLSCH